MKAPVNCKIWFYADVFSGIRRFYDNLKMMYGFRPNPIMMFMWTFASPIFCLVSQVESTKSRDVSSEFSV